MIEFTAYGRAQPAGSKKSYVPLDRKTKQPFKKNGRIVVSTVDDNPKAKDWKAVVSAAAAAAMAGRPLLAGPLVAHFTFYRVRPKGHFRTGRNADVLKASAPKYPTPKPDVLKLTRAAEDAMQDVVYRNDSQIVRQILTKAYGEPARVEVKIVELSDAVGAVPADEQRGLF